MNYIIRLEYIEVDDWVTDIHFETLDGLTSILTVLPGYNFKTLEKITDSNETANEYLEKSIDYYFSNECKILPKWAITSKTLIRRPMGFKFKRVVLFNCIATSWIAV